MANNPFADITASIDKGTFDSKPVAAENPFSKITRDIDNERKSGTLTEYGKTIAQGVKGIPSYIASSIEGSTPYDDNNGLDATQAQHQQDNQAFINAPGADAPVLGGLAQARDIRQSADSMSGSFAGMTPTLAGAATGAAIGSVVPVVGTGIGAAVGGLAGSGLGLFGMKRAAENQFVRQNIDKANSDLQAQGLPDLSQQQAIDLQNKINATGDTEKIGWSEAGPETVGNLATTALLATPLGKVGGAVSAIASPLTRALATGGIKAAGTLATEAGEEEVTRQLQNPIMQRNGFPEQGAGETLKQTLISTLPMAVVGGGVGGYQGYKGPLSRAANQAPVINQPEINNEIPVNENQPNANNVASNESQPAPGRVADAAILQGGVNEQEAQAQNKEAGDIGFKGFFEGAAKGISDGFLNGIYESLVNGKDTFAGVKDPAIRRAKPAFDAGLIKSPSDIQYFEDNGYPELTSSSQEGNQPTLRVETNGKSNKRAATISNIQPRETDSGARESFAFGSTESLSQDGASGAGIKQQNTNALGNEGGVNQPAPEQSGASLTDTQQNNDDPRINTDNNAGANGNDATGVNAPGAGEPGINPATTNAGEPAAENRQALPDAAALPGEPGKIADNFQQTHELSDGTPVQQVEGNTYRDNQGDEYQDDYAMPIVSQNNRAAKPDSLPTQQGHPIEQANPAEKENQIEAPVTPEPGATSENEPVAHPILTTPKTKYLQQTKSAWAKSNPNVSLGDKRVAFDGITSGYDNELDKASASLPFEQYQALPVNKGQPEGVLKQAYDGLRQEHGITNETTQPQNTIAGETAVQGQAKGGIDNGLRGSLTQHERDVFNNQKEEVADAIAKEVVRVQKIKDITRKKGGKPKATENRARVAEKFGIKHEGWKPFDMAFGHGVMADVQETMKMDGSRATHEQVKNAVLKYINENLADVKAAKKEVQKGSGDVAQQNAEPRQNIESNKNADYSAGNESNSNEVQKDESDSTNQPEVQKPFTKPLIKPNETPQPQNPDQDGPAVSEAGGEISTQPTATQPSPDNSESQLNKESGKSSSNDQANSVTKAKPTAEPKGAVADKADADELINNLSKKSTKFLHMEGGKSITHSEAIHALEAKMKRITDDHDNWTPRDEKNHPIGTINLYKLEAVRKIDKITWAIHNNAAMRSRDGEGGLTPEPENKGVSLSSIIDKVNKKHGNLLDDSHKVPVTQANFDAVKKEAVVKPEPTTLLKSHDALMDRLDEGNVTADELKAAFESVVANKEAITAELNKLSKDAIVKQYGAGYLSSSDKKDRYVSQAYNKILMGYRLSDSMFSYSMGKDSFLNAVRDDVNKTTDESIKDYAADRKKAQDEYLESRKATLAGMENPETYEDFARGLNSKIREGMKFMEAYRTLTLEQRITFDSLWADKTRSARMGRADQQKAEMRVSSTTAEGQIVETEHTKTGEALFVVKAADRVEKDVYTHWNNTAKLLGGHYSSFRGAGAVPGFQFKSRENAEAFLKFIGGDATDAKEVAQVRRDAFADDRSQSAVERLVEMADKLEEKADESLGRERKANTHKRAGEAARAEGYAQADKAMSATMRNIANAIQNGTAKLLDRVRQKTQVEMLQSFVHTAQSEKTRTLYPAYIDQQRHEGEKPTAETAEYAEFPAYTIWRSNLADMGRKLQETEGFKKLGASILKEADDVSAVYLKWARDNIIKVSTFSTDKGSKLATFASKPAAEAAISRSGYKGKAIVLAFKRGDNRIILSPSEAISRGLWEGDDKMITLSPSLGAELVEKIGKKNRRLNARDKINVAWQLENAFEKRKRLAAMGIETSAELRVALREFIALREAPKEADKIKEMERAMVGRANDGLDFFPTPAGIADQMIEAADIKPGMSILEPSAGMGHIAERIREAGAEPDVVEMSNSRKELLEAKGFNVVGRDFMDVTGNYDRIIMNPPFGDRRDAEHVQHAYDLLNPGGRVVAIMGEGVFFGSDKKAVAFRDWLEQAGGTEEKLPDGSFLDPSLPVNTGVNARMVVIEKPEGDINSDGNTKFSKSTPTTGSTVAQIKSWLPARVAKLVASGKLEVVQTVGDLPSYLQQRGTALYHAAFHGSPHDHNKFDSSKIGTGEGAAAFGAGHYFTDSKEIAEWYRDYLTDTKNVKTHSIGDRNFRVIGSAGANYNNIDVNVISNGDLSDATQEEKVALYAIQRFEGDKSAAKKYLIDYAKNTSLKPRIPIYKEAALLIDRIRIEKGKLYSVELTPTQDEYLDWDKPLSEQSELTKKILRQLPGWRVLTSEYNKTGIETGDKFFLNGPSGKSVYEWLAEEKTMGDKAASAYLRSIGIRGIRYKAEAGKSEANNYVVFDDKDISITAKYSQDLAGVEALYDTQRDKLYLVADMLNKDNIQPIIAHELLHRMLATDPKLKAATARFDTDLQNRLNLAAKGIGTPLELAAYQRVESAKTPLKDRLEEFKSYLVSQYALAPDTFIGKLKRIFDDFIAAIRIALIRSGLDLGYVKSLMPADLMALSKYGAKVQPSRGDARNGSEVLASKTNSLDSTERLDAENNDIRFSRAEPIRNMVTQGDTFLRGYLNQARKDSLIYNLQDRFIDLKREIEKAINNGGTVGEANNPYLAEELYHQRSAARIKDFYTEEINPMLKDIHDNAIDKAELERFAHARHAPSRNKVMSERNPNQEMIDTRLAEAETNLDEVRSDPIATRKEISEALAEYNKWNRAKPFDGTEEDRLALSGMSDQESRAYMAGLTGDKRRLLTDMGDKIDAINNKTLDLLVEYGMETKESVKALKEQWEHYVPLHRDEAHPDDNNFGHPIGRGFSVSGSGMKNATGSTAEVTNILAHITAAREQMLRRGEKNTVSKTLANFIRMNPDPEFAEIDKLEVEKALNDDGLVESRLEPAFKRNMADNVLMYRVDGKNKAIVFNDKKAENLRLALSLKNLDGASLDVVENLIAKGTRWFSKVNTQFNVVFGVVNLTRDTQGMMLNLSSTDLHGHQADVFKNMKDAFKAIYQEGRPGADPALQAMYKRFNRAGGTTGFSQMFGDIGERNKSLEKELKRLDYSKPRQIADKFIDSLSLFNNMMENSTRLAIFMTGINAGMSEAKSASLAKNTTVNFNRKGAQSTKIGAFYAFFNASAQGTMRTLETLNGPRGKQILAGGVSLGALSTLMGIAMMGDDDWERIPEFIRERSLIIPTGGSNYLSIPMPLGFHLLPNIGRKMVESAFGSNRVSPTQRLAQLAGSTLGAFNPLGGADLSEFVMPTVFDPALALWRNKDWTGMPIYREDFNSLKPTTGFSRAKNTASTPAKLIAEGVNKLTGGTDYKQGAWSPTPDQIDYIFGQLAGGTGRELLKLEQSVAAQFTGEDLPLYKVPLVGRFAGETGGNAAESSMYYENIKTLNEHKAELEGLKEERKMREALVYARSNPEVKLLAKAHGIELSIKHLKKRRDRIEQQGNKAAVQQVNDQIAGRMKALNDAVVAARKR